MLTRIYCGKKYKISEEFLTDLYRNVIFTPEIPTTGSSHFKKDFLGCRLSPPIRNAFGETSLLFFTKSYLKKVLEPISKKDYKKSKKHNHPLTDMFCVK